MTTRTVHDIVYTPSGTPWEGALVNFDLVPGSYVPGGEYPASHIAAFTGPDGTFSVVLWCTDEGQAPTSYAVKLGGDRFTVHVPVGTTPITLSELRALTSPESQPTPPALAAHEAAADPHPGYLTPAEGNAAYTPLTHATDTTNPHAVTAAQVGAYTTAQVDAAVAGKQPIDSDLTAIAALTTTAFGRSLLTLVDAAAGRVALGVDVYDLAGGAAGKPIASAIILTFVAVRAYTLPINLAGSQAKVGTAATASTTFTIKKNAASIGTFIFAIAGTSATFTFAAAVSFAAGDILTITAPASQDATLADLGVTLRGTF